MNVKDLLNTDVEVAGQWLRQGFQWWIDELLQLIPTRWKSRFERKRGLIAETDGVHLKVRSPNGDLTDLSGLPPSQRRLDVMLSEKLVLTRVIDVPLMRLGDVLKMVDLEIDRLTPFAPGTALFDAEIVHRHEGGSLQKIRIGVLPRSTADHVMAFLASAGIVPLSLRVSSAVPGIPGALDFLGSIREARGERSAAMRARIVWLVVIALFVFNIAGMIVRDMSQLQSLRDITASQGSIVSLARRLREKVDVEATSRAALLQRRATSAPLGILNEVTKALPLDAWIQKFEWDAPRLHLTGYGKSATAVLQALKRSPTLRNARSTVGAHDRMPADSAAREPFDIVIDVGRT